MKEPPIPESEFSVIQRYFEAAAGDRAELVLGIGDDAALLSLPAGADFVSLRGSASGRELQSAPRACAGALLEETTRRLAESGVRPLSFSLSLTLPTPDPEWLSLFSSALHESAAALDIALVGGDTTAGPWLAVVHCHGIR